MSEKSSAPTAETRVEWAGKVPSAQAAHAILEAIRSGASDLHEHTTRLLFVVLRSLELRGSIAGGPARTPGECLDLSRGSDLYKAVRQALLDYGAPDLRLIGKADATYLADDLMQAIGSSASYAVLRDLLGDG